MIDKKEYDFILGMRAKWHNSPKPPKATLSFMNGYDAMTRRFAKLTKPTLSVEATMWAAVSEKAWGYVMSMPWGAGTAMGFRLAQLADVMVEKLQGQIENDVSFMENLSEISKLGIDFNSIKEFNK